MSGNQVLRRADQTTLTPDKGGSNGHVDAASWPSTAHTGQLAATAPAGQDRRRRPDAGPGPAAVAVRAEASEDAPGPQGGAGS